MHFERNVLAHVPNSEVGEVAEDLKAIFKVRKHRTARALCEEFVEAYRGRFAKAISLLKASIEDALAYLQYPGSHHAKIRSTNPLERLFRELKRRTRVVGVFPNETSAQVLATEIMLRSSEEWALRRYLTMDRLTEVRENHNPQHSRRCLVVNISKIVGLFFTPKRFASYSISYLEDVSSSYKPFISTCP